ncbi:cytochrome C [Anaerobacillus alkaliphilus]|uniref:Cytochrome C n=1 Tax=Anaerobacillus alkaliphilus TaxID=1548597 RepID=A0A4Q0VUS6_9BACI|nr:NapC/NirT family cytochrome c [Anaerobacillus alkaliphilus]RXJ01677.1 cytochrome C [Anaerobacillus alkaliphilus]
MDNDEKLSESQRVGFVRRLWIRFKEINWKDPINKWKFLFFLIVTFFGIAFSTYGVLAVTSTQTFCNSCHEMAPENVTHLSTSHSEVKCTKCHIEPGLPQTIKGKVMALKEVYRHVTRTQPNPIAVTHTVNDVVCLRCHSENRDVTPNGDLIVAHQKHIHKEIACVTCHSGVAHAKTVERGLNTHDLYDYWVMDNAKALVTSKYINPNMGTCIDCHEKYNQGLEPWRDKNYALTIPPNKLDETYETVPSNVVLREVSSQITDVEVSMECATCHSDIDTPKDHNYINWNNNHGKTALTELNKCVTCHEEDKWVRRVQPQTMEELLKENGPHLDFYVPDIFVVKSESRKLVFCYTCHSERPEGHKTSDEWLTGHAKFAETEEQKRECFVCHDTEKEEKLTAPTDVYCEYCHRTGLKK